MYKKSNIRLLRYLLIAWIVFSPVIQGVAQNSEPSRRKTPNTGKWNGDFSDGPEIILYNANIITLDDLIPVAEAIAVDGNRISAVGTTNDILALQTALTLVIDLEGRTVLPGFIEGHTHYLWRGWGNSGLEGLQNATESLAADGYTSAHEIYNGNADLIQAAAELAGQNQLAVRVHCYFSYNTAGGEFIEGNWNSVPYTTKVDTMVRNVGVKMFMDGGSVNLPCLSTVYQAGNATGLHGDCYFSQEDCDAAVSAILSAGYPIAAHAIGDSAAGVFIDAVEKASAGGINTLRSRIEHLRFIRDEQIEQMAGLGLAASIQYTWNLAGIAPRYEATYSPEALKYCYPWRKIADHHIPILGGNDFPVAARWTHAMKTISAVVTRKDQPEEILADWMEGKQITVDEAIRGMTVNNAWACFEENELGTITVGKLADITVFSDNPYAVDPFDIRYINVEMTIVDGVIRYNQIGLIHQAVHDAGAFRMGIDDRGLWGRFRALTGLRYGGSDYLPQGSLMIALDEYNVANALRPQYDFKTSEGGSIAFYEPGLFADEEGYVAYKNDSEFYPGWIEVKQTSYMWENDSSLLIKYIFRNVGKENLTGIYFGQMMDFDILGWQNLGYWNGDEEPGFGYMINPDVTGSPYIGMAMFGMDGKDVNTSYSFLIPSALFNSNQEMAYADRMKSGVIEESVADAYDYSLFPAIGPFTLTPDQSISPFFLSISVGDDPDDLRSAMKHAVQRSRAISLYSIYHDILYDTIEGADPVRLSLDLYIPGDPSPVPRPVLVYIHGGGWKQGDKEVLYLKKDYFTRQEYILASINTRLSPDGPPYDWDPERVMHPDHAMDAASAIAYLYKNITSFGGDSSRIALMGFSSGSQLAAIVSTDERFLGAHALPLSVIKAAVCLDGASYDLPLCISQSSGDERDMYINAMGADSTVWADASPSRHIETGRGIPPFLFVNRDDEECMRIVNLFKDSLTVHGIRAETYSAGGLEHPDVDYYAGDANHPMTPVIRDFLADCLDFNVNVENDKTVIPVVPCLYQNMPNPFNPVTEIPFDIVIQEHAILSVYDVLGRKVVTLLDKHLAPGIYRIPFDGTSLPSGIYFYTLKTGSHFKTKKCLLLK